MVAREKKKQYGNALCTLLYIGLLVIHEFDTHKENLF